MSLQQTEFEVRGHGIPFSMMLDHARSIWRYHYKEQSLNHYQLWIQYTRHLYRDNEPSAMSDPNQSTGLPYRSKKESQFDCSQHRIANRLHSYSQKDEFFAMSFLYRSNAKHLNPYHCGFQLALNRLLQQVACLHWYKNQNQ